MEIFDPFDCQSGISNGNNIKNKLV